MTSQERAREYLHQEDLKRIPLDHRYDIKPGLIEINYTNEEGEEDWCRIDSKYLIRALDDFLNANLASISVLDGVSHIRE